MYSSTLSLTFALDC